MIQKLQFPTHFSFYAYVSFFILFFCIIDINAQCAGNDNILPDVCNILAPSNQSIDLVASLGPHTAGGTWNDDGSSGGLDAVNGILYPQEIKISGTYQYTYSLNNVNGCTDSATITITIGGYTGIGSATNACSDDSQYILFQAFNGAFALPQEGGLWHDDTPSGGVDVNNGILNATIPPTRINYSYTYSIDAIGTCPQVSSKIQVYISPKPLSGSPSDLNVCSNNLAGYTNFNLNNLLTGEDPGGTWTELSGTTEISPSTDNTVNIQNIYNTQGTGSYSFRYTVIPERPVCRPNATTTVTINIEQLLDLTGATLTVNPNPICEDEIPTATYTAIFTQGIQNIPNGNYEVTYTINGASAPVIFANCINGQLIFVIPSSHFQGVGNYTIAIANFRIATSPGACFNIMGNTANTVLHINPIPKINNATLTIDPVCQTFGAMVAFSGTSNLADGDYNIVYNLTGSNTATPIPTVLNISGGLGSFIIPTALIPNAGSTTIRITNITNTITGCTNSSTLAKAFTVNPLPDVTNLVVTIKDVCQGQPETIKLSGLGTLTSIAIDYTISGFNTVASQNIPLTVVGGATSFAIPTTDIPNVGLTSFTITTITNVITGCALAINNKTDFTVNPLPTIPVAADIQPFCTADNATVANLVPQGNQYVWYDSTVSTVPLIATTPLVTGDYFVKEVNLITGCESGLKMIDVIINTTPQINSATLTIDPICQGFNATVNFSGTSNLTDGNYDILYNLSGSNRVTAVPATLNVTSGLASFSIASNLIPNSGNTTITIASITNTLTHCSNTSTLSKVFVVNAVPDITNMVVTIKDACLGQPANVQLSGLGALTNITLSYSVSGSNTISSQTIPLVVSAGATSFLIPAVTLTNTGNNTLTITDLTNTGNSCSIVVNSVPKNFTINPIPSNPTANNQQFCETNLATVASLIPNGNQYKWFDSPTSTTALSSTALLQTATYYVKEVNTTTGCDSGATQISVVINVVPAPVLIPNGQDFCGVDKPTIQSLTNNTTSIGSLTWYDAAANGTQLSNTDLLVEGFTYYGFTYSSSTDCYSTALQVTVSLTDCTIKPEDLFIPDGFSPNGDNVNDTFQIVDIEFLYPNYTLEIFNRYGNVLFKGNISKPFWDGKNSSSNFIDGNAPAGVYFYIINYNKDNLKPKQGKLYLNR